MKLGTKIAVTICAVFAAVLGAATTALVFDELDFVEEEMDVHGRLLGHVVASAAAETLTERGERAARELVHAIDQREERITIRWIDIEPSRVHPDHPSFLTEDVRQRLREGKVVGRISPRNEDTLYTFVPVTSDAQPMRVIQIAESLDARNDHVRLLMLKVIGGAVLGFLLSLVLAYVLGRRLVGRPVTEMIDVARQVGAGDFSRRADESRGDELGVLAREMNAMGRNLEHARRVAQEQETARHEMEDQLRHADRLATIGRLASGVAHEVGTPLQSITIRADMLAQRAGHVEGVPECVNGIKRQSGRVATIVRNLLRFARKQEPQRAPRDLRAVVEHTLELVKTAKTKAPVEIVPRLECESRTAAVDEEQIEQVLTNLVLNSMQAMPEGGTVTVGLEPSHAEPPPHIEERADEYVCLFVEDEGTGIPEDALPHLFDPFFTTKGVDEGTGLGLSISYGIVREHGGWIDVKTSWGRGSRFSVHLPAVSGASPKEQHAPS